MLKLQACQRFFVLHVIFVYFFVVSNAYILAPKESSTNSLGSFDQYLLQNSDLTPNNNAVNEEDDLAAKIIEWFGELDKQNEESNQISSYQQSSDEQSISPFLDSKIKDIRDRRQAMGIYDDKYFKHKDKALVEKLKSQFVGQSNFSRSDCMSSLLRIGIKSIQELIRAEEFCALQA